MARCLSAFWYWTLTCLLSVDFMSSVSGGTELASCQMRTLKLLLLSMLTQSHDALSDVL